MPSLFKSAARQEVAITITPKTFAKVLLLILATMLLLAVVERTVYAFTLIIIALFLALALYAPVSWLERHLPGKLRNDRGLATALTFLAVAAILVVFLSSVVPPIVRETQAFITNIPNTLQQLRVQYRGVNAFVVRYHLQGQVDQLTSELTAQLRNSGSNAVLAITGLFGSLVTITLVLVLSFLTLVEAPAWMHFFRQLVPDHQRNHVDKLRADMYKAVRGYINGQLVLALIAAVLLLPGLLIFHVPYPFALMGLVFICALIPMIGHTIAALIVAFIALFYSPWSAIGILIYYFLYQQVEIYLIAPRIQASNTNLSPLLVLLALTIGLSFDGLLGGLVAIPLAACLKVLAVDYLESRQLLTTSDKA